MKREFPEIQSAKHHGRVVSTVRGAFRGRSGLLKALLRRLLGPHGWPAVAETTKGAVRLLEHPRIRGD